MFNFRVELKYHTVYGNHVEWIPWIECVEMGIDVSIDFDVGLFFSVNCRCLFHL